MSLLPKSVHKFMREAAPVPYGKLMLAYRGDQRRAYDDALSAAPSDQQRDVARILDQVKLAHFKANAAHLHTELLAPIKFLLGEGRQLDGCVVEAGCYKGASAAKLSLVAAHQNRKLHLFDSFEGLPETHEPVQTNIFGREAVFHGGEWAGSIDEVKHNISSYGRIDVCEFHKGWFCNTMPSFQEPIACAYVDVDLVESTRDCMKFLFPLLVKGGAIFSQDGHLPLILDLVGNESFWRDEVGAPKPRMTGFGTHKLLIIHKD